MLRTCERKTGLENVLVPVLAILIRCTTLLHSHWFIENDWFHLVQKCDIVIL